MSKLVPIILAVVVGVLSILCLRQCGRAEAPVLPEMAPVPETKHAPVAEPREEPVAVALPDEPGETTANTQRTERTEATKRTNPFLELLEDPEKRKTLETMWTIEMDTTYGPLLRSYEMLAYEFEDFKDLLVAKKAMEVEYRLRRHAALDDPEELVRLEREKADAEQAIESQMREYLGGEAYAVYEGYEKSLPERTMLTGLKQGMENLGLGFSYEQEDELILTMYEERLGCPLVNKLIVDEWERPTSMSDEDVDTVLREYDYWVQRISMRVNTVLSPGQQSHLKEHLVGYRDYVMIGLMESDLFLGE